MNKEGYILLNINYNDDVVQMYVEPQHTVSMINYYLATLLIGPLGKHYNCILSHDGEKLHPTKKVKYLELDHASNLSFSMEAVDGR